MYRVDLYVWRTMVNNRRVLAESMRHDGKHSYYGSPHIVPCVP